MHLPVLLFLLLQVFGSVKLHLVPSSSFLEHVEIEGTKYNYSNFATGCQQSTPVIVTSRVPEIHFKFFSKESVEFRCAATSILRNKERTCRKKFNSFFACTTAECMKGVNVFFDRTNKRDGTPSIDFDGLNVEISFTCVRDDTYAVESGCIVINVNVPSPSANKGARRKRFDDSALADRIAAYESILGVSPRIGFRGSRGKKPASRRTYQDLSEKNKKNYEIVERAAKPEPLYYRPQKAEPEKEVTYNNVQPRTYSNYCTCGNVVYYFTSS